MDQKSEKTNGKYLEMDDKSAYILDFSPFEQILDNANESAEMRLSAAYKSLFIELSQLKRNTKIIIQRDPKKYNTDKKCQLLLTDFLEKMGDKDVPRFIISDKNFKLFENDAIIDYLSDINRRFLGAPSLYHNHQNNTLVILHSVFHEAGCSKDTSNHIKFVDGNPVWEDLKYLLEDTYSKDISRHVAVNSSIAAIDASNYGNFIAFLVNHNINKWVILLSNSTSHPSCVYPVIKNTNPQAFNSFKVDFRTWGVTNITAIEQRAFDFLNCNDALTDYYLAGQRILAQKDKKLIVATPVQQEQFLDSNDESLKKDNEFYQAVKSKFLTNQHIGVKSAYQYQHQQQVMANQHVGQAVNASQHLVVNVSTQAKVQVNQEVQQGRYESKELLIDGTNIEAFINNKIGSVSPEKINSMKMLWSRLVGEYAKLLPESVSKITHVPASVFLKIFEYKDQFGDGIVWSDLAASMYTFQDNSTNPRRMILCLKQEEQNALPAKKFSPLAARFNFPEFPAVHYRQLGTVGQFFNMSAVIDKVGPEEFQKAYEKFIEDNQIHFERVFFDYFENSTRPTGLKQEPTSQEMVSGLIALMCLDNPELNKDNVKRLFKNFTLTEFKKIRMVLRSYGANVVYDMLQKFQALEEKNRFGVFKKAFLDTSNDWRSLVDDSFKMDTDLSAVECFNYLIDMPDKPEYTWWESMLQQHTDENQPTKWIKPDSNIKQKSLNMIDLVNAHKYFFDNIKSSYPTEALPEKCPISGIRNMKTAYRRLLLLLENAASPKEQMKHLEGLDYGSEGFILRVHEFQLITKEMNLSLAHELFVGTEQLVDKASKATNLDDFLPYFYRYIGRANTAFNIESYKKLVGKVQLSKELDTKIKPFVLTIFALTLTGSRVIESDNLDELYDDFIQNIMVLNNQLTGKSLEKYLHEVALFMSSDSLAEKPTLREFGHLIVLHQLKIKDIKEWSKEMAQIMGADFYMCLPVILKTYQAMISQKAKFSLLTMKDGSKKSKLAFLIAHLVGVPSEQAYKGIMQILEDNELNDTDYSLMFTSFLSVSKEGPFLDLNKTLQALTSIDKVNAFLSISDTQTYSETLVLQELKNKFLISDHSEKFKDLVSKTMTQYLDDFIANVAESDNIKIILNTLLLIKNRDVQHELLAGLAKKGFFDPKSKVSLADKVLFIKKLCSLINVDYSFLVSLFYPPKNEQSISDIIDILNNLTKLNSSDNDVSFLLTELVLCPESKQLETLNLLISLADLVIPMNGDEKVSFYKTVFNGLKADWDLLPMMTHMASIKIPAQQKTSLLNYMLKHHKEINLEYLKSISLTNLEILSATCFDAPYSGTSWGNICTLLDKLNTLSENSRLLIKKRCDSKPAFSGERLLKFLNQLSDNMTADEKTAELKQFLTKTEYDPKELRHKISAQYDITGLSAYIQELKNQNPKKINSFDHYHEYIAYILGISGELGIEAAPGQCKPLARMTKIELHSLIEKCQKQLSDNPNDMTAKLQIVAIVCESMFRATGHYPYYAQIIAVLEQVIDGSRSKQFKIPTSQGKTMDFGMMAACELLLSGKNYAAVTSHNDFMIARDYETNKPFFDYLGLESTLIDQTDDQNHYAKHKKLITYSTSASLSLYESKLQFINGATLPPKKERTLYVDEFDEGFIDDPMDFNFSEGAGDPYSNPLDWVYPLAYLFVKENKFKKNGTLSADVENFKLKISSHPAFENNQKLLSDNKIKNIIIATMTAAMQKEQVNFLIRKKPRFIAGQWKEVSVAHILDGDKENTKATMSNGVQQALHARLNIEKASEIEAFRQDPTKGMPSFTYDNEFDITDSQNTHSLSKRFDRVVVASATPGNDAEKAFVKEYFDIYDEVNMPKQRTGVLRNLSRIFVRGEEGKFYVKSDAFLAEIKRTIDEKDRIHQPILISVKDIQSAETLYSSLEKIYGNSRIQVIHAEVAENQALFEARIKKAGEAGIITIVSPLVGRGVDIKTHTIDEQNILNENQKRIAKLQSTLLVIQTYLSRHRIEEQLIGRTARGEKDGEVIGIYELNQIAAEFGKKFPEDATKEQIITILNQITTDLDKTALAHQKERLAARAVVHVFQHAFDEAVRTYQAIPEGKQEQEQEQEEVKPGEIKVNFEDVRQAKRDFIKMTDDIWRRISLTSKSNNKIAEFQKECLDVYMKMKKVIRELPQPNFEKQQNNNQQDLKIITDNVMLPMDKESPDSFKMRAYTSRHPNTDNEYQLSDIPQFKQRFTDQLEFLAFSSSINASLSGLSQKTIANMSYDGAEKYGYASYVQALLYSSSEIKPSDSSEIPAILRFLTSAIDSIKDKSVKEKTKQQGSVIQLFDLSIHFLRKVNVADKARFDLLLDNLLVLKQKCSDFKDIQTLLIPFLRIMRSQLKDEPLLKEVLGSIQILTNSVAYHDKASAKIIQNENNNRIVTILAHRDFLHQTIKRLNNSNPSEKLNNLNIFSTVLDNQKGHPADISTLKIDHNKGLSDILAEKRSFSLFSQTKGLQDYALFQGQCQAVLNHKNVNEARTPQALKLLNSLEQLKNNLLVRSNKGILKDRDLYTQKIKRLDRYIGELEHILSSKNKSGNQDISSELLQIQQNILADKILTQSTSKFFKSENRVTLVKEIEQLSQDFLKDSGMV